MFLHRVIYFWKVIKYDILTRLLKEYNNKNVIQKKNEFEEHVESQNSVEGVQVAAKVVELNW